MDQSATPPTPQPPSAEPGLASGAAATPAATGSALSSMQQVTELADGLTTVADRLHERILQDIRRHGDAGVPASVQEVLRQLLDDEMLLRQRANTLYADAAAHVIQGLGHPQARLNALTRDAADKVRRIGVISETTGLVGGLLLLAGAVTAGHPGHIGLALEKIHLHNEALDLLAPAPPAPAA